MSDAEFLRAIGIVPYVGAGLQHESAYRKRERIIQAYALFQLAAMLGTLIWTLKN